MKKFKINYLILIAALIQLSACDSPSKSPVVPVIPSPSDKGDPLVSKGRDLFLMRPLMAMVEPVVPAIELRTT